MIIFLYGEDSFRSKKKLEEIIEQYKKARKSGLNLVSLDAKEKDFSDLLNHFKVVSMFAETKLIILKNLFNSKNFSEEFLKHLKELNNTKDIIVIFENEKIDERSKLFKDLKKSVKSQEFKSLTPNALLLWIDGEFKKYGAEIEPLAKNILISYIGNNLWHAENEIKKLVFYKPGFTITPDHVRDHVRPKIENDIFKTIDAMAQNNKKEALSLLHKHINSGDNVLYLLSMIAYQFRNLILIKDLMDKKNSYDAIVKKSGLHPFVVKKNYYICSQFSLSRLKENYYKIFQIDSDIKTGKIDPELALELLISDI